MTDAELRQLADVVSRFLKPHLERSPVLRETLGLVGRWLVEQAQGGAAGSDAARAETARGDAQPEPESREANSSRPASDRVSRDGETNLPVSVVPLQLGDSVVRVPVRGLADEVLRAQRAADEARRAAEQARREAAAFQEASFGGGDLDLKAIEDRCLLKAEACRLELRRRAAAGDIEADHLIRQEIQALKGRAAALEQCRLWVWHPDRTQPSDEMLQLIAANYEAHAEAAALVRRIDERGQGAGPEHVVGAFHLLAEANSALRAAIEPTWLEEDPDQRDAHFWLRRETKVRWIRVEQYMKASERADPGRVEDRRARIRAAQQRLNERVTRSDGVTKSVNKIRYHAKRITLSEEDEPTRMHWATIAHEIERLGEMGVAPTDARIGDALGAAAAGRWSGGVNEPRGLGLAVRRLLELAQRGEESPLGAEFRASTYSESVLAVRDLMRGRRIVIIGGEPDLECIRRYEDAFELAEAEWVELVEHGPGTPMRAPIRREDTALVIVIIRLTGHLHAEEARDYCQEVDRPCVLLRAGFSPEQAARAILEQASERVRGADADGLRKRG